MKVRSRVTLLLVCSLLLAAPAPLRAAEDARARAREAWIARLRTELSLDDEQVKGVRSVLESLKPGEASNAADGSATPAADRKERSQEAIKRINDLLTAEQRARWAQMREKRRHEHGAAPGTSAGPATPRN
jgi:septal ring factor EnvC (AmiA/AmiB activator)